MVATASSLPPSDAAREHDINCVLILEYCWSSFTNRKPGSTAEACGELATVPGDEFDDVRRDNKTRMVDRKM